MPDGGACHRGKARRFPGTVRLLPLHVISFGLRTKVRERRRAFLHPGDQPSGGEFSTAGGSRRRADFNLDDVARLGHRGAGRGAGQDDVALLERQQLGQVRNEPREGEKQAIGGVVLDEVAVVPGPDAEAGGVHGIRRDQPGTDRGEAVAAFGPEIGTFVRVAEIVDAEVVAGGHPLDMAPGILHTDASGGLADDQGDLALKAQEFAPGRTLHNGRGCCRTMRQRGRRLQEVGRLLRRAATLGCPAGVVNVHRDDLAGRGQGVLGDLIQELLLIEYEIVYEAIFQISLAASMVPWLEVSPIDAVGGVGGPYSAGLEPSRCPGTCAGTQWHGSHGSDAGSSTKDPQR
ncbi:hypothetical protein AHiyo4_22130 [Arthrobacter sp. Hiyo4]|nr:hypothetical protein AHiyo4_22130 [Arthrobacter sp. Hiyo4]